MEHVLDVGPRSYTTEGTHCSYTIANLDPSKYRYAACVELLGEENDVGKSKPKSDQLTCGDTLAHDDWGALWWERVKSNRIHFGGAVFGALSIIESAISGQLFPIVGSWADDPTDNITVLLVLAMAVWIICQPHAVSIRWRNPQIRKHCWVVFVLPVRCNTG